LRLPVLRDHKASAEVVTNVCPRPLPYPRVCARRRGHLCCKAKEAFETPALASALPFAKLLPALGTMRLGGLQNALNPQP